MRNYYFLILCLLSFGFLSAQEELSKEEKERRERNIQAGNPFAKFGYKAKVATLSKGKYLEVHDLDSIVTIGTTRWHVDKNKIVGDIVIDSLNPDARPIGDVAGRWISPDPLSEEFPSWSPYNFCFDNPLKFVDPDGRAPLDWWKNKKTGQYVWYNDRTSDGGVVVYSNHEYIGGSMSDVVDDFKNSNNFFVRLFSDPKFGDYGDKWNGEITADPLTTLDNYAYSDNILKKGAYDLMDQPYVAFQSFNPFDNKLQHLNGDGVSPKEKLESGVMTLTSFMPQTKAAGSLVKPLNAAQFSKTFKGTFIPRLAPKTRGFLNRNLNSFLNTYTNEAFLFHTAFDNGLGIGQEITTQVEEKTIK